MKELFTNTERKTLKKWNRAQDLIERPDMEAEKAANLELKDMKALYQIAKKLPKWDYGTNLSRPLKTTDGMVILSQNKVQDRKIILNTSWIGHIHRSWMFVQMILLKWGGDVKLKNGKHPRKTEFSPKCLGRKNRKSLLSFGISSRRYGPKESSPEEW